MAYAPAKFENAMSNGLGGYLQENTLYTDLDLWFKVTQNVAQYPLHHTPYAPTEFEVASSNSLGRDEGPRGGVWFYEPFKHTKLCVFNINIILKINE